jgi:4a-hydroxytetrahydrobiopterin dehydratase
LKASYTFSDFRTAFAFITLIAIESEKMDHHPEWSNAYNKVNSAFPTHDAGNKITNLDTKMAHYISETAKKF